MSIGVTKLTSQYFPSPDSYSVCNLQDGQRLPEGGASHGEDEWIRSGQYDSERHQWRPHGLGEEN